MSGVAGHIFEASDCQSISKAIEFVRRRNEHLAKLPAPAVISKEKLLPPLLERSVSLVQLPQDCSFSRASQSAGERIASGNSGAQET